MGRRSRAALHLHVEVDAAERHQRVEEYMLVRDEQTRGVVHADRLVRG